MKQNRGVVYKGPNLVEVQTIDYPKLEHNGRNCPHGVILKVIATNICGSDQHMVRGRTSAPSGLVLGHEITGEVIEIGSDVEFIKQGDLVSVPFNIACGRCRNCKAGQTSICLTTNESSIAGAAYGYVDMGGWIGGQAEYVMVPYADFNLLKFPNKERAMEKIKDLALLSDVFPTGFHGAVQANVGPGSIVYVAGAGPIGLACAASCQLLGAACVIVGDLKKARLAQASSFGCYTVDLSTTDSLPDAIEKIVGVREVDSAIDCVGFEAKNNSFEEHAPAVLNTIMRVARAGSSLGIVGLYVPNDPGSHDASARQGELAVRIGLGWAKSLSLHTGQTPVMRYNRQLMNCILYDKIEIAKAVNVEVVSLDDAVKAYHEFDNGAPKKFIVDPHGLIR
ncbi:formaldehyde dehydrogenase, glutathione-independent [Candidatus Dependentiae bacterium]|nr:formaldehyde dehydrogenase, glutathione-independent [Candidatus Dependentiae bacterium]MCC7415217.1 formaldehyde dehydrogenase, glutathione-independent [Campylobacterota bacterium]